jgi:hypothetical protein
MALSYSHLIRQPQKGIKVLTDQDVSYLDKLLLDINYHVRAVAAADLREIPHDHLMIWATKNGVYQFATTEMIEWLKNEIGDNKAIEIGAGCGVIARSLGIIGTDSYIQHNKKYKEYYDLIGHEITRPPKDIKKYESLEAVRVFRPHTVVGAFITQYGTADDDARGIPCAPFGTKEKEMLKKIKKYIHFGNKVTHACKHIYQLPHQELHFDWLFNRALDQSQNRVWIWENK